MVDIEEYKEELEEKFEKKFQSTSGTGTGGKEKGDYGQDIILTADDCESCDTLINILSEPVLQNKIEVIKVLSNRGQNILSQMPDDIALPLYVVHERDGYKKMD